MRAWVEACVAETGSQNVYTTARGKYIWEVSRTEHYDGAITGTVLKVTRTTEDGREWVKPAGSWRIEGDGTVSRGPASLKAAAKNTKPVPPLFVYGIGSGGVKKFGRARLLPVAELLIQNG